MKNPDKAPDRPTVPAVLTLVRALYATDHGRVGGCLHILLDDGNVDDDDARFCLDAARAIRCPICLPVAEQIMQLTVTQRRTLVWRASVAQSPQP